MDGHPDAVAGASIGQPRGLMCIPEIGGYRAVPLILFSRGIPSPPNTTQRHAALGNATALPHCLTACVPAPVLLTASADRSRP